MYSFMDLVGRTSSSRGSTSRFSSSSFKHRHRSIMRIITADENRQWEDDRKARKAARAGDIQAVRDEMEDKSEESSGDEENHDDEHGGQALQV